jgi:hypothetical protein
MWRYLKAAFLARPVLPLLGPLPLNLMGVAGFAVLGALHPAAWLLGLGAEIAYLFLLANNGRFQDWVDAGELAERRAAALPESRQPGGDVRRLVDELELPERQRLLALKGRLTRILGLYEKFRVDAFTLEQNRASLSDLVGHYARLLAARASILKHWSADPQQLRDEIGRVEAELDRAEQTAELRASRTRTLEILRVRLLNQEKKETVLAEIDSELQGIEQQFDLALENAAIGSKPHAVAAGSLFDPARFDDGFDPLADLPESEPPRARVGRRKVRAAD